METVSNQKQEIRKFVGLNDLRAVLFWGFKSLAGRPKTKKVQGDTQHTHHDPMRTGRRHRQ